MKNYIVSFKIHLISGDSVMVDAKSEEEAAEKVKTILTEELSMSAEYLGVSEPSFELSSFEVAEISSFNPMEN